ncbi:MAG: hypothetical protein K6G71_00310 [Clostridiales bacterium]|nr:hypothetical protein [Clostridiales bacterium]
MIKKIIALALCAVLASGLAALPASAAAADGRSELPIIYVYGRHDELVTADGEPIPAVNFKNADVSEVVDAALPSFWKGVTTGDWSGYADSICRALASEFDQTRLSKDGEVIDGSHIGWTWDRDTLWDPGNGYDIYDYGFVYDYRVSPIESAEYLAAYIDDVLDVTGFEQVNIVGRCQGCEIVQAYLYKYGCSKVRCYVSYTTAANGVAALDALFTGDANVDLAAIDRYLSDYPGTMDISTGDGHLDRYIKATISAAKNDPAALLTQGVANLIWDRLYDEIVPDVVLYTYGTYPAFWGLLSDDCYDDAKELVFSGREEEYAGLIEKIDAYRVIQQATPDMLERMAEEDGLQVCVIAKYGYQDVPFDGKRQGELGDGFSPLVETSYGATCAKQNGVLDKKYIESREAAGCGAYISPDRQVDASTCLFPDKTWIIKGIGHIEFPGCINRFMLWFFINDGEVDVNSGEEYPQFMVYDRANDALLPADESNTATEGWSTGYFSAIFERIKAFFSLVAHLISNLFGRE